jgi:hypothetical protein
MTMIYLVQAAHWNIPGRMTKAFATEHGAQSEAISLVTIMLNDSALESVGDWVIDLARVQNIPGARQSYVEIIPLEVCP